MSKSKAHTPRCCQHICLLFTPDNIKREFCFFLPHTKSQPAPHQAVMIRVSWPAP